LAPEVLAQGPGAGGDGPAQLEHAGRQALSRRRLDPPELKLGLRWFGSGVSRDSGFTPPLAVDDPVLENRAHGVQPSPPDEPDGPAVIPGPDVDRLAVQLIHVARTLIEY
jgi:hypothetical protein